MSFEVRTTGKWILAGEHAVLRGVPALVFPLESRALTLKVEDSDKPGDLTLECKGEHGEELQLLFWGVLEKACGLKNLRRSSFSGKATLTSRIPVGAGLGASAALCVAMSRWFASLNMISQDEVAEFSRTLENLFHGESSGVDIAVAMQGRPLMFQRGQTPEEFPIAWAPKLYVSYSGQRGVTLECVQQVKRLHESQPEKAQLLDEKMRKAVATCSTAFRTHNEKSFSLLTEAIMDAADCFSEWGLVEGAPQRHMDELKAAGAVAAKPTGSGKGGYILSLWKNEPPVELKTRLIPCFSN